MKKQIFNIPTTVTAQIEDGRITSVRIVAAKETRSAIWNLATNDQLNPGVAQYHGGAPTVIALTPYPGYNGILTANLAYAFALLANVEDWTDLFVSSAVSLAGTMVEAENFTPYPETLNEIQLMYLNWKSVSSLRNQVHNLAYDGYNAGAILEWYQEAVECFRRSSSEVQATISWIMSALDKHATEARRISAATAKNRSELEEKVKAFETLVNSDAPRKHINQSYFGIVQAILVESGRLQKEVELHKDEFRIIQNELMTTLRLSTPPAPPKSK